MSENDIRMDADKWECELMEDQLKRLQTERDEAVAAECVKDLRIQALEEEVQDVKRNCAAEIKRIKKLRYKHFGKLGIALGVTVAVALLAWVGMETATLCASVGKWILGICLTVASFLVGWIFERMGDNLKLEQKTRKKLEQLGRKGE